MEAYIGGGMKTQDPKIETRKKNLLVIGEEEDRATLGKIISAIFFFKFIK